MNVAIFMKEMKDKNIRKAGKGRTFIAALRPGITGLKDHVSLILRDLRGYEWIKGSCK